jgi:hypothetical protein
MSGYQIGAARYLTSKRFSDTPIHLPNTLPTQGFKQKRPETRHQQRQHNRRL